MKKLTNILIPLFLFLAVGCGSKGEAPKNVNSSESSVGAASTASPNTETTSSNASAMENQTNSGDIDKILDKMETIADKTVAINNKMKNGDFSVASDMANLSRDYQDAAQQLENLKANGITPSQMERYMKISNKISGIVQN